MMQSKAWWQSRMLWLNALFVVTAVVAAIDPARLPVDEDTKALIAAVVGAANMYLRLRTNQGLR